MRCEDVRPLLPELAEGRLRESGPAEVHLAACAVCSSELARYRELMAMTAALRHETIEPPPGLLDLILTQAPERRPLVRRVAGDERFQHAALSLGGVVVGATAVGLLWWRLARRTLGTPEQSEAG
jgi:hypothetical protein